ncbi:MAG: GatB/YqeY domain-containing protein [Ignavibacteria bacterium]|nr:GatB/YqeY domain-containing protein [Ignavibacteria bacterium]
MSLKNKINEDLKRAMLSKDSQRVLTLRAIRAEILKMDKSGMNREMTADEEIQLLTKQAKMRKEAIEIYEKAGRKDLEEQEKIQLNIIGEYLPKQISKEEAKQIIAKIITDTGASDIKEFGKIMGLAMKELKGKIEGSLVQEIVRSKLNPNN